MKQEETVGLKMTLVKMQSVLPLIANIVKQTAQYFQVDIALALMALLGAASTSLHYQIDVKSPLGKRHPVSLALMLFLDSGGRKSSVLERIMAALYSYEVVLTDLFMKAYANYKMEIEVWKSEKKILERLCRKEMVGSEQYAEVVDRLEKHIEAEPEAPWCHQLIFEDSTFLPFITQLSKSGHAAIVSAEGMTILEGKLSDEVAAINAGWSGEKFRFNRTGKPPMLISNPRVTSVIAVQEEFFRKLGKGKLDRLRASGFLARQLVFSPDAMMGSRLLEHRNESTEYLKQLDERLTVILEGLHEAIQNKGFKRKVVTLSPEADAYWRMTVDNVERMMAEGEFYAVAGDHASKLGENVLRVAAVLHEFEGLEGPISKNVLEIAKEITRSCSHDFMRIFCPPPRELVDADDLYAYFQVYINRNQRFERKTYLRQCAPNKLRKDGRFNEALAVLINQERIRIVSHGRTEFIDFMPHLPYVPASIPSNNSSLS